MSKTIEQRLEAMGHSLPDAPNPVANYTSWYKTGDLLFISGQISMTGDGTLMTGTLGRDLDVAEGQEAARASALSILAQAKAALGSLDNIRQIVKLTGFVAATPWFIEHPQVINGASDLLAEALGDAGRHTRAAVGVTSLPLGAAVEIDAVIKFSST